jgi:uncharacterized protein
LRRAKSLVQAAVKKTSQDRDIKDILRGGEVAIPLDGMHEPRFRREGAARDTVLPGNKKFVEGDILPRSGKGDGGKPKDPGDGDGEDAFRFVLSRDEFVDLFLDDLELPDLTKRKLANVESDGLRRAGFTTSGSPANISVSRTVALARRVALRRPRPETIEELEAELADCDDEARRTALIAEIEALKAKVKRIPFIDPIDIRYRRFESISKPVAQAVMFCLMDVSGSMSEHMKDLAKRFYMLLYVFLKRRYRHVEIVFIRHTDRAEEVDEQTFFYGPASGGTLVSSALQAMHEIVRSRFRPLRLEHLRRASLRRRQLHRQRRSHCPSVDGTGSSGEPVLRLSGGWRSRWLLVRNAGLLAVDVVRAPARKRRAAVDAQGP